MEERKTGLQSPATCQKKAANKLIFTPVFVKHFDARVNGRERINTGSKKARAAMFFFVGREFQ